MFRIRIKVESVPFQETRFAKWLNAIYLKNGGKKLGGYDHLHYLSGMNKFKVQGNLLARLAAWLYVAIRTSEQNREAEKVRADTAPLLKKLLGIQKIGVGGWGLKEDDMLTAAEYQAVHGTPRPNPLGTFIKSTSDWATTNPDDPDRPPS